MSKEEQKRCNKCGQIKPRTEFYGRPKGQGRNQSWCKECSKKALKEMHLHKQETDALYVAYKRAKAHEHKAIKIGLNVHFSGEELLAQFESQGKLCYYCQSPVSWEKCQIDHKTPLSRGGDNSILNIAITCATCNREKKILTEAEYINDKLSRFGFDWKIERQRINALNLL